MGEPRRTNLASVRSLATVTDKVDTHLSLGSLNGRICLARWDSVPFCEQQEVVDQGLHVLLHRRAGWRANLVILHAHGTCGNLIQALVNNAQRLPEFFHTAQIPVVAVTVDTDGDVKLDLIVRIIRLGLADIPRHTGAAKHDTAEAEIESVGSGYYSDILGPVYPDPVVREEFLRFVDTVRELCRPLVNVIQKTEWEVLMDTSGSDIGGMQTGS